MFTGLIQTLGSIYRIRDDQLKILCTGANRDRILVGMELGDSIAVDGVCLTVAEILPQGFVAAASPETLRRSTLGDLQPGSLVNVETSLRVGSKIGGHFVTGHVDGRGYLDAAVQTANAWEISFKVADAKMARYIVSKGSVAVNGISLTVADCSETGDWFMVAVIPVTYAETNLQYLQPGSPVNLEGDVLGKYVEKFVLRPGMQGQTASAAPAISHNGSETSDLPGWLTPDFLAEHGYH
ncbi:MAG: riboflavin synthase [Thainema sp.]